MKTLAAGRVGRPHGLEGFFHVSEPAPELLPLGGPVIVGERRTEIVGRKGTEDRPLLRIGLAADRNAAVALRGQELRVPREVARELDEDEYWADDLAGCRVIDGDRELGIVRRLVGLPTCEALDLDSGLLVPMVRDAIVRVDIDAHEIHVRGEFFA